MHIFFKGKYCKTYSYVSKKSIIDMITMSKRKRNKKKMEFVKIHRGVFFSCNTFLLVEDDVIEIANFLWLLMVNDRYVCGIVVSWENLSGVVSLCGWMLIGCLFIDGTTTLMLDVVIETALTMVAVVLPLTGIYKNNTKLSTGLAMY